MKKLLIVITLLFLFFIAFSCQQGPEGAKETIANVEADIQAIRNNIAEFNAGITTGDIDRIMAVWANDCIRIPPNQPATSGKEVLRSIYQKVSDQETVQEDYVVKNIDVSGNLAFAHLTYSAVGTPKAGGEPFKEDGNWIIIFRKQPDDKWKRSYSIWSNENLIYPTQTD
jgi:ketosteroid isomerase-like protein